MGFASLFSSRSRDLLDDSCSSRNSVGEETTSEAFLLNQSDVFYSILRVILDLDICYKTPNDPLERELQFYKAPCPLHHSRPPGTRIHRIFWFAQSREEVVEQLLKDHTESTAWGSAGPAANDFRSDVITTPSLRMLAAIVNTTLRDDVFQEDSTTTNLESDIAARCGKPSGLFTITGTMANQLALRTLLTQPPHAILTDSSAHILTNEAGGPAFMSGAMIQAVQPSNGKYLTLEDIRANAVLSDNVHKCPTRVIALENTVSGIIVPLSEMRKISQWARANGVKIHLDGARLFEAVAAGAGSMREYGELVDTLSVDFSKNLGAPMGAMLLSTTENIHQARRIRKSIGGGMRQAGVLSAAARVAVEEQFGSDDGEQAGKLRRVHESAKRVGKMWQEKGGRLTKDVETNQVWIDLKALGVEDEDWNEIGRSQGVSLDGPRIVLHHQIGDEAIRKLEQAFDVVLSRTIEIKSKL